MLDEANSSFVNGVVTVVRWTIYITIAMAAIGVTWNLLAWLWKKVAPTSGKSDIEEARQRLRDLGY